MDPKRVFHYRIVFTLPLLHLYVDLINKYLFKITQLGFCDDYCHKILVVCNHLFILNSSQDHVDVVKSSKRNGLFHLNLWRTLVR
jgi:hypothetical protein